MTAIMDLIGGEPREILLAIAIDDWAGLRDRSRFDAHLSLGDDLDPTWLDHFSEAARAIGGRDEPLDFVDARQDLDGPSDVGERTVERIDPAWIAAVARIPDRQVDAVAGRWIALVEAEQGELSPGERSRIRGLAEDLVRFARDAEASPAVLFAWSL